MCVCLCIICYMLHFFLIFKLYKRKILFWKILEVKLIQTLGPKEDTYIAFSDISSLIFLM